MNTDPIADLLTRIRNADKAGLATVRLPHSKIKFEITQVMKKYKFITDTKKVTEGKFPEIEITLNTELDHKLTLTRVSKPGQRIYLKNKQIKPVLNKLGIAIISTPHGIISDIEARKKNTGGEVLCEIY